MDATDQGTRKFHVPQNVTPNTSQNENILEFNVRKYLECLALFYIGLIFQGIFFC